MQRSSDAPDKNAVTYFTMVLLESVLIPTEKRITACVSSQVGCSLALYKSLQHGPAKAAAKL